MNNQGSMSNQLTVNQMEASGDIAPGFGSLQSFELSQRAAKMLSMSSLVPKEFQGNLPNCVIALNMASRMGADPLMVMQNLYIVHGRPSWSSQFLISTFNTSGRFSALRYTWIGEEGTDNWGCKAWATERATGEKLEGSLVTIDLAKKEGWFNKNGSKWQTMPQQMLMYRAASWFVRAYAPELAMGMHTMEEVVDITDADYQVVDTTKAEVRQEISEKANAELITMDNEDPEAPEETVSNDKPDPDTEQELDKQQQLNLEPDF